MKPGSAMEVGLGFSSSMPSNSGGSQFPDYRFSFPFIYPIKLNYQ